jgi:type VI secretion system secreted protein Hcp
MASKDYFLKIEGVEGESGDSKHKGEIDIESFEWGESRDLAPGDLRNRQLQMTDFHFTTFTSKASTKLMTACATVQKFEKATFTLRKAGGDQQEYMKFIFYDVRIASYSISGPATETSRNEKIGHEKRENSIPLENIVLNYGAIEVEYREQKSVGDLGGKNRFNYNLKQAVVQER